MRNELSRRRSNFQHGSGSFKCEVCGRGTRNTGVQSLDSRTCPQCYELAGIDNLINDSGDAERTPGTLAIAEQYLAEIGDKGGDVDAARKSNPYIWPTIEARP